MHAAARTASAAAAVVAVLALGAPPAASSAVRTTGPPEVGTLRAPDRVSVLRRFEATARIEPSPANPFDPGQIDVQVVFTDPSGVETRALGFFFQDYRRELVHGNERLTATGEPVWKVRFAPPRAGRWRWHWEVRSPAGIAVTNPRALEVTPSHERGYVRRSEHDHRFLAFDDGSPYFAVGENTGWYDDRGTYAYDDWFRRLAAQDANYGRLWMASFGFGLEWADMPLGDYRKRLDRAWQLDHVINAAERRGIYVVVSLLNHGAFSTTFNPAWAENPYNAANGGPLASPSAFFTDPVAKELFRRRLRYVVARWGYSTHVLSWELWNEAELTDGYDSAASTDWHREMAAFLRALDPAQHLVTTSFALAASDPSVWSGAGLDYTQLHYYARAGVGDTLIEFEPNIARHVDELTGERLGAVPLPVLFAELGVDARGPSETREADPMGIGIHDGLWSGAVSGGAGTAMTWWWDNLIDVQPRRYYPMFGAVARFVRGVDWGRSGFVRVRGAATAPSRPLVLRGLVGRRLALLWIKDDAYQWNSPDRVEIRGASIAIDELADGRWCGTWWNTWMGRPKGRAELVVDAGAASIGVPRFAGDIALRLERC